MSFHHPQAAAIPHLLPQGTVLKQDLQGVRKRSRIFGRHQPPGFRQHKFRRSPGPDGHHGQAVTNSLNKGHRNPFVIAIARINTWHDYHRNRRFLIKRKKLMVR